MAKKKKYENPYGDVELFDPAKRAALGLDAAVEEAEGSSDVVIHDEKLKEKQAEREAEMQQLLQEDQELLNVDEALKEERVLAAESDRKGVRVAFFTQDTDALIHGSATQKRFLEYGGMFLEVHVIVLSGKGESTNEPARVQANVWIYATNSDSWWRKPLDAHRVAKEQLDFAQGFRADIIVAEDPFESGAVGYYLAKKYDRAFQMHIREDYLVPEFKDAERHNGFRLSVAKYIMNRTYSVRTISDPLKEKIVTAFPHFKDEIEILPVYYNLTAWREAAQTIDLHQEYPTFKFIIFHASSMTEAANTVTAVDGLHLFLKRHPTVGLVIAGDGPRKKFLNERIKILGIESQVVFLPEDVDIISCMKTADLCIHLSKNTDDDYRILQIAAVGTPLLTIDEGLAEKLFVDGESALLCPLDSPPCIGGKVMQLLNQNILRTQLGEAAQDIAFDRVEQDYESYLRMYRDSIERSMIFEGYSDNEDTDNNAGS